MSKLRDILDDMREVDGIISRLERAAEAHPDDEISRFNAGSFLKRRNDLVRRLNDQLRQEQADLIEYRMQRPAGSNYPVRAVTNALGAFQELLTAVFDTVRSGAPKRRYRPSNDSINLSTLDFASARSGSMVLSLSVPNERLLLVESELDRAFSDVFTILRARTGDEFRQLVGRVGVASISKVYQWADANATYGIDTRIRWGKSQVETREFFVSRSEAGVIRDILAETSEEETTPAEISGVLLGFNAHSEDFQLKSFDEVSISGKLSDSFPVGDRWIINAAYKARLTRTATIKFSTGEETERWVLQDMSPLTD